MPTSQNQTFSALNKTHFISSQKYRNPMTITVNGDAQTVDNQIDNDSLEPLIERGPPNIVPSVEKDSFDKSNQKSDYPLQREDYRDKILNKFQRKSQDKVIREMRVRDAMSPVDNNTTTP